MIQSVEQSGLVLLYIIQGCIEYAHKWSTISGPVINKNSASKVYYFSPSHIQI